VLAARAIVAACADAAGRWTDADFPPRVRASRAIGERLGYSETVVDYALDKLFGGITTDALTATIESELGSLAALDGFVERHGRPAVTYAPAGNIAIVSSDATIGVAIPPLVFALCAKATVLVKDRDDRLVGAFLETLAEDQPALAGRALAEPWDGVSTSGRLAEADVVVAFGRDETLREIRAHLAPHARFVPFGHRTSVCYVTRAALAGEAAARRAARGCALDALLYDGEGCLSAHVAFVETGTTVSAEAFAALLCDACDEVAVEFPAASREFSPAVAAYHRSAFFRSAQGAGVVRSGAGAPHLVVYDPPRAEPPPLLPRVLALYSVAGPGEALAYLHAHAVPLEAFATDAPEREDIARAALASGAARIAPLGELQNPPLAGNHGGEGRILPFVRAIYRG
jgi:hypothetical protein